MSMFRRVTMPLLTTLAAMVIIAHGVEEDMQREYRQDLRPRLLDTGTPNNDQAWRVTEVEQEVQKPRLEEIWNENSPDGTPKRRRPGRKRKRRPETISNEEILSHDGPAYPNEPPRPYYDVDYKNARESTELPQRRRKKPDSRPIRWTDDDDHFFEDRPLRNNGGRRKKRPSFDSFPELSEFRQITNINYGEEVNREPEPNAHEVIDQGMLNRHRETIEHETKEKNQPSPIALAEVEDPNNLYSDHINSDKSLSEFSLELSSNPKVTMGRTSENYESRINIPEVDLPVLPGSKILEWGVEKFKTEDKTEGLRTIEKKTNVADDGQHSTTDKIDEKSDELSLKDILKRSNGTSLSEILQQHNLTLSDLLHGKEQAVSILKNKNSPSPPHTITKDVKDDLIEGILMNSETKYNPEPIIKYTSSKPIRKYAIESVPEFITEAVTNCDTEPVTEYVTSTDTVQTVTETKTPVETTASPLKSNNPKPSTGRRFLVGIRKKLRMRPILNTTSTFKGQLNRDVIVQNSRKYSNFRRNRTKSDIWKSVLPALTETNTKKETVNKNTQKQTTTDIVPEETTIAIEIQTDNIALKLDDIDMDLTASTVTEPVTEITTQVARKVSERPVGVVTMARPTAISSGLRQQALNNRLKRKRIKNKISTTESSQDDIIKHLYGMSDLVSSSEFIARNQEPQPTETDTTEITTLKVETTKVHIERTTTTKPTTQKLLESTPKETAKLEIDEIFTDSTTKRKLARILKDRNMTLNELVELRERGSSHVHLADIFHNASKEPNPAEPFLSKSLLEPISKETYPLRAILDANLHDQNGKISNLDSNTIDNNRVHVVMDFRNNVNEHAENMGIISLFNNHHKNSSQSLNSTDHVASNLTAVKVASNTTNLNKTARESRKLEGGEDDVVSWNEIFSMMGRNYKEESKELPPSETFKKITLDDADRDGLILLADLQRLAEFDNIASVSKEKLDLNSNVVGQIGKNINDKIPSHTKSVTIASASVAGLAMVLFLLAYATFKWRRQQTTRQNPNFCNERIPTPVYEPRKCNKNNASTRSISPMLQTSNIYTLNTLDSQNGKESPDYMWDSLRKPFQ